MPKAKPSVMMELWSINRWLRWTGVRLAIEVDIQGADSPTREPTRIGLVWWGWKDLFPRPPVSVGCFVPFDPLDQTEDIYVPVRPRGRGHCGHAPKCINSDEHRDERDPLGCCNCGTRKAEQEQPLAAFSKDLAALQAALPPVDDLAESKLERR
jgi:hypothetical protein